MAGFIACNGCSRPLHVPQAHLGKYVRCSNCCNTFRAAERPEGSEGDEVPVVTRPNRRALGVLIVGAGLFCASLGLAIWSASQRPAPPVNRPWMAPRQGAPAPGFGR